uniref:hypothetical chloroplast RF19 n=1 Tax=Cyathodium cavernarum TaxID=351593 RepID=UPI0030FEAE38
MITNIPLLLSVLWVPILSWINHSNTFVLFGIYYGFVTTLSINPSQLLAIRAFLLEGNLSGIAAVGGSITGQFLILLSIYYSPLYSILIKPHLLTFLTLPHLLFYRYSIKDLINYQSLKSVTSSKNIRIYRTFFDNLIFQLFNPVVLPNPILARLFNIFVFRYSHNSVFLSSSFFGWFVGQVFFINSCKLLLFRIESDSPILYLLVKRIIYRTFSIIILSFSLLNLGRTPIFFITKKSNNDLQFELSKLKDSFILTKFWSIIFFDYRRWNRPFRYIENNRFSNQSPMRKKVSQYFFETSLSDGKPRLLFTYLPSLYSFGIGSENTLINCNASLSNELHEKWVDERKKDQLRMNAEIQDRFKLLYNGFFSEEIIDGKKIILFKKSIFTKTSDPLLTNQCRKTMIISKSPRLLTENSYRLKKNKRNFHLSRKDNKLKHWFYIQCSDLENKNAILPWEPLNRDAKRVLSLLVDRSRNVNDNTNSKQMNFFEENILLSNKHNIFPTRDEHGKTNRKSNLNWELILNLSPQQKSLFFYSLQNEKWNIFENSWKNLFFGTPIRIKNIRFFTKKLIQIDKHIRFGEIGKKRPKWISNLKNDKFDVIAAGVTDIRQRKVKNLGYLVRGKDKRRKIMRRFSQQSDFRRKLVKGSTRARRRKTLISKMFQLKIKSPFFSRITEKSNLLERNYLNGKNISQFKPSFIHKKNISEEKMKADRFAVANRWDFPLAQWGRSWLLLFQSYCRKYVILPILIILKNFFRLSLFQKSEWNQDWSEWKKEIHIRCTYDGTEVSKKELPEQWLKDGLQIKIIYPFYLKPWHEIQTTNLIDLERKKLDLNFNGTNFVDVKTIGKNKRGSNRDMENKKLNYCYLTAWGFQTNLPFGTVKKQPSFWKPLKKELRKKIFSKPYEIVENISKITKLFPIFSNVKYNSQLDVRRNENINGNLTKSEFVKRNEKIIEYDNHNNRMFFKNSNNHSFFYPENTNYLYIKNLEYLIKNKYLFINKSIVLSEKNILTLKQILIKIKQRIIKFYRKNVHSLKKTPLYFRIGIKKITLMLKINIGLSVVNGKEKVDLKK